MKKGVRGRIYLAWAVLCLGLFAGCGEKQNETTNEIEIKDTETGAADIGITFTDALGASVTVTSPKKTAVLSGSFADAWLLAGGELFAVTEDAKGVISVTPDVIRLGSLKTPGVETMIAEGVDFAILSAAIGEHVQLRDTLEAAGITTAYFEVETFSDYKNMMAVFTEITGRQDLYEKNVTETENGIKEQIKRAERAGEAPSVLFLRAYSTGVRAKGSDSMTGQMLKDLGCSNIADGDAALLDDLSMEAIIAADPDYIFVTTMGESEEAALSMTEELLTGNPAWNGLSAVKAGHYYVLPKELFHNKPNNRWDESYRILADDIYGED